LTQDAPWEDWSRVFDVNIHGVWRCQKHELKQMSGQDLIETRYMPTCACQCCSRKTDQAISC
jgi:hypothetical protein